MSKQQGSETPSVIPAFSSWGVLQSSRSAITNAVQQSLPEKHQDSLELIVNFAFIAYIYKCGAYFKEHNPATSDVDDAFTKSYLKAGLDPMTQTLNLQLAEVGGKELNNNLFAETNTLIDSVSPWVTKAINAYANDKREYPDTPQATLQKNNIEFTKELLPTITDPAQKAAFENRITLTEAMVCCAKELQMAVKRVIDFLHEHEKQKAKAPVSMTLHNPTSEQTLAAEGKLPQLS